MKMKHTLSEGIERFIKLKKAGGRAQNTIIWYEAILKGLLAHFGDCELESITDEALIDFLVDCRERMARDAADSYTRGYKSFFSWVSKRYEFTDPMRDLAYPQTKPTPVRPLKESDFRKLFELANTRDKALLVMLLATGARASEILQMTLSGTDLINRRFLVVGKGAKYRYLQWDSETNQYLLKWLEQHNRQNDYIWTSDRDGQPLTYSGLRFMLKRLAKKAGIDGRCHLHMIRYLAGSTKSKYSMSQEVLRRKLGHESVKTTQRYTQFDDYELHAIDNEVSIVAKVLNLND